VKDADFEEVKEEVKEEEKKDEGADAADPKSEDNI